ncbi:MAG: ATP-dependent DNA ligase [Patescibacteria group bacterium]
MKISKFAEYLLKLEETSKRLEITEILKKLLEELDPNETRNAINLTLGQLKAPFDSERFNIAEKMMMRIIENSYETKSEKIKELYKNTGDLGSVAFELSENHKIANIELNEVYEKLLEIAKFEGTGSQEKKVSHLSALLTKVDGLSAKFIIRMVLGTTRLGFTALTIVDALSSLAAGDKSLKKKIEGKYNVHPDIALIAELIKKEGIKGINSIAMEPGVPLLPQKPQRIGSPEEIIEKMGGEVWAEFKFDGTRVQLHLDRSKKVSSTALDLFNSVSDTTFIKTFTRNLDETTHQFPDIIEAANKFIKADSVILDGEAIGFDKNTGEFLNFQETIQRKRKHDIKYIAKQIPLKYLVFDILYLNGKSLLDTPLVQRRARINEIIKENEIIEIDKHLTTDDPKKLGNFFNEAKEKSLEGLVVKNPNTGYQAGARSFAWVKLKRLEESNLDDTIDCVVLGYYNGKGARADFGIGGFLVGVYDKKNEIFKTVSKIGTGLKDEDWVYLKKECDKIKISNAPANVEFPKELEPDVWTSPKIVVVIRADEISKSSQHTAEYALRFPRLMEFRKDKAPEDVTTVEEIKSLYKIQTEKK